MSEKSTESEVSALKLLADCRGKMRSVAASLTGDAHEQEDLVMRAFERALANFASFDPAKGSLEAWMATILRNLHASDHRRKLDGKVETVPADELETTLSPVDNSTLQGILRNSDRDALKSAIDSMKKSDREALTMYYFLEMPVGMMAKVLCQPVGTVKCRLARARAALGEILVKRYGRESFVALMASALAVVLLFRASVEQADALLVQGGYEGLITGEEFMALRLMLLWIIPDFWLYGAVKRRHLSIQKSLPFVLDLLTLSVEAGMDFISALQRNCKLRRLDPLNEELLRMTKEIQVGSSRKEALKSMADRVRQPDLKSVAYALIQADELGVSIGAILRIQSEQLRARRFDRAEKLAAEAPVKMLGPLMLCIFPAVFIILLGPIVSQAMKGGI